jgi:ABC-type Fe3+-hydroxamate transport system substrate-binding protein
LDKLLKDRIDVIIWSASSSGWKQRRVWKKFQAVQKKQVYADFDQDALLRPGPRLPEAVRQFRKILEKWSK